MNAKRFNLLIFTILLTLLTLAFGLFISIRTTFFSSSLLSLPADIWSIFIFLIISTLLLVGFQVALKIIETKDEKVDERSDTVRIMWELDGAPVTMETSDKDRVEEILMLIRDIQARQPSCIKDRTIAAQYTVDISSEKVATDER